MSAATQNPTPTTANRFPPAVLSLALTGDLVRSKHIENDTLTLSIRGEISVTNSMKFRNEVLTLIAAHVTRRLIMNLEEVPFIDSSACAVLVEIARYLRLTDRQICLINPQLRVQGLLEITRLTSILPIVKDETAIVN